MFAKAERWICFFFQDKFLEEEETGNFFGFNFNSTVARDAGILTALTGSLNYLYDNVIDSYVENVYTLVVQEYTIATIKVKSRVQGYEPKIKTRYANLFLCDDFTFRN